MRLKKKGTYFALLALAAGISTNVQAEEASGLAEMVSKGSVNLDFRYRYEFVDEKGKDQNARASTLRSRLTFGSATYKGFSFLGEFDNVAKIGDDNYNSTENGKTEYPVVADPTGTDINQVWLKYSFKEGADFGAEIDLVATWPVNEHLTLEAKFADFDADHDVRDRGFRDTTKAWMTVQFKL